MAGWTKTGKPKYAKGNRPTKAAMRAARARMMRVRRNVIRNSVPERASCSEVINLGVNQTNQLYTGYQLALNQFDRAVAISKGYQFFRIKSVTYTFKPLYDTFISGSGTSAPNLYYMIDRTKQLQLVTNADQLKKLGAIPHRLDEKVVRFHFKPSVLNAALDDGSPFGGTPFVQYKVSPWLPVRDMNLLSAYLPNSTDHLGVVYIVENAGGANINYAIEKQVEFEFKKPFVSILLEPGQTPGALAETVPAPPSPPEVPPA